jgi:MerR family transcriptional regulator/heat shock protein HspR
MYSDEDIARLRTIKRLVDDLGLNLAGVDLVLKMRDVILNIRGDLATENVDRRFGQHLDELLDDIWKMLAVEDESGEVR